MSRVEIVEVSTESELDEFIDLPWKIYRHDSNWIPPLKKSVRNLLDAAHHPFWRFSERALFLARRSSETVGRIAGIVDNNYNSFHDERVCAWGFFECRNDPEAAEALFGAVEEWATGKGMVFLRGPLNPSTNYEVGLLVEGREYPPSLMMPYNPGYYSELVERLGFAKEKDLLTLILDRNRRISDRMVRLTRRIGRNKNISIRNAEKKSFTSEMKLIGDIYNASWSRNWGFVPMTEAEMLQMGKDLIRIADTDGLFFIYYYGEPVGVTIALPDVGPLLKRLNGNMGLLGILRAVVHRNDIRGARVVAMGFKKTHQGLGLPILACDHLMKVWDKKAMDYIEVGWNLEDNHSIIEIEMEFGARMHKRHRVFRKDIVPG